MCTTSFEIAAENLVGQEIIQCNKNKNINKNVKSKLLNLKFIKNKYTKFDQ